MLILIKTFTVLWRGWFFLFFFNSWELYWVWWMDKHRPAYTYHWWRLWTHREGQDTNVTL